ncbi:MAG: hypothetical protein M1817_000093 [Caeruleum heppii]|nr:MAG: hypothetical protein M1817_000093 [Caeruleum heppii]
MTSLLGEAYASSDEDSTSAVNPLAPSLESSVVAAPDVSLEEPAHLQMMLANPTSTTLTYNAPHSALSRPVQGPANPYKARDGNNALKRKNVLTGFAEEAAVSDSTFTTQHRTYQSLGYTKDPSGADGAYVGDLVNAARLGGRDVIELRPSKEQSAALRRKRQRKGDAGIVDGEGAYKGPWARYRDEDVALEAEAAAAGEALASDEEYVEEAITPPPAALVPLPYAKEAEVETTEFHGSEQYDYQGRTYMHVPQDLSVDLRKEPGSIKNYAPKKQIHTWKYHTKAITGLKFFPSSGHLLLSSSADAKIALWDVYHNRELLRTFSGHNKSVADIDFSPDAGSTFLSSSYDRSTKLWDTETGTCISRFSTGKIPHVIRFSPSSPNEFLAGMSDKKIVQHDIRIPGEKSLVQEYDHHLGAINTLTFCDEGRRFVSTSDDKSLRAWEFGIPVPIKFIAEPYMYPLVTSSPHPSGKSIAFQSGDNQIVVYASSEKFRQNRKKSFRGHNNAGYAIEVSISPDGNMVMSGDSAGWCCVWDWKTCKMWHKWRAVAEGKGACLKCTWHPQEGSKVVTGGLDGVIKYFD